jgi:hypothetical protein
VRKTLVTLTLLASVSPAAAWTQQYSLCNQTSAWPPPLEINGLKLNGNSVKLTPPDIGPGACGTFIYFKDAPSLYWITISSEYRPTFTCPTQFNAATQTKITITNQSNGKDYNCLYQ